MEITMKQVFQINTLFQKFSNKVLNLQLSFKIAKGFNQIQNYVDFYQKEYNKYLNVYIEKDENGNFVSDGNQGYKIIKGKEQECKRKIEELDKLTFNLENFYFNLEELKELELTVKEMMVFIPFIKEKTNEQSN